MPLLQLWPGQTLCVNSLESPLVYWVVEGGLDRVPYATFPGYISLLQMEPSMVESENMIYPKIPVLSMPSCSLRLIDK